MSPWLPGTQRLECVLNSLFDSGRGGQTKRPPSIPQEPLKTEVAIISPCHARTAPRSREYPAKATVKKNRLKVRACVIVSAMWVTHHSFARVLGGLLRAMYPFGEPM